MAGFQWCCLSPGAMVHLCIGILQFMLVVSMTKARGPEHEMLICTRPNEIKAVSLECGATLINIIAVEYGVKTHAECHPHTWCAYREDIPTVIATGDEFNCNGKHKCHIHAEARPIERWMYIDDPSEYNANFTDDEGDDEYADQSGSGYYNNPSVKNGWGAHRPNCVYSEYIMIRYQCQENVVQSESAQGESAHHHDHAVYHIVGILLGGAAFICMVGCFATVIYRRFLSRPSPRHPTSDPAPPSDPNKYYLDRSLPRPHLSPKQLSDEESIYDEIKDIDLGVPMWTADSNGYIEVYDTLLKNNAYEKVTGDDEHCYTSLHKMQASVAEGNHLSPQPSTNEHQQVKAEDCEDYLEPVSSQKV